MKKKHRSWNYLNLVILHQSQESMQCLVPDSRHIGGCLGDTLVVANINQNSIGLGEFFPAGHLTYSLKPLNTSLLSIQVMISSRGPIEKPRREVGSTSHLVKVKKTKRPHTKDLKVCLLNVRLVGSDKKEGQIQDFVVNEALDCLAFTETWLRPDDLSAQQVGDITHPGYSFCPHARKGR